MQNDSLYFTETRPDYITPMLVVMGLVFIGLLMGFFIMIFGGPPERTLAEHFENIISVFK